MHTSHTVYKHEGKERLAFLIILSLILWHVERKEPLLRWDPLGINYWITIIRADPVYDGHISSYTAFSYFLPFAQSSYVVHTSRFIFPLLIIVLECGSEVWRDSLPLLSYLPLSSHAPSTHLLWFLFSLIVLGRRKSGKERRGSFLSSLWLGNVASLLITILESKITWMKWK